MQIAKKKVGAAGGDTSPLVAKVSFILGDLADEYWRVRCVQPSLPEGQQLAAAAHLIQKMV
jgi:hypothetical protein